jgi:hypothetical protein
MNSIGIDCQGGLEEILGPLGRWAKRRPRRHLQPFIGQDPHALPYRFIRRKLRLLQTQLRLAAIIFGSIFIHNEVTPQAASCSTRTFCHCFWAASMIRGLNALGELMTLVCGLLGSVGYLTNKQEIFYALIALVMANTLTAVIYRAEKNKWDFSFIGKSYFTFELFNWSKYGIFAVIQIILFLALALTIAFLPSLIRNCVILS